MLIAHEAPISIFEAIRHRTDYDYCLVHLLDENEKYKDLFFESKRLNREIILDNSVFELGEAYNRERYIHWIETLQPDWYIIPDVLENADATIESIQKWHMECSKIPGKKIGVVQGKNVNDFIRCYKAIHTIVDKLAISFDYSFFIDEDIYGKLPNKFHYYMYGRDALLHYLLARNIIDKTKPHHLLGCSLPQELRSYKTYEWIDSVDTSNPVVAGIKGMRYNGGAGLYDKPSQKLFELISYVPNEAQLNDILYNVKCFEEMVS